MTEQRSKSRVIVLDDDDHVLLFRTYMEIAGRPLWWITPGGHVEPGESHHVAAVREMQEETGLVVTDLGAPVWVRDWSTELADGGGVDYHEEWYLLRTPRFAPVDADWTPEEHDDIVDFRWWSLEDLESTDDEVSPPELATVIRRLIATPGDMSK